MTDTTTPATETTYDEALIASQRTEALLLEVSAALLDIKQRVSLLEISIRIVDNLPIVQQEQQNQLNALREGLREDRARPR